MELLTGIAIGAVIWYGGVEVFAGKTTTGAFFSFVAAMIMSYAPAKTLATLNNSLQEGMAAASRLFAVLDSEPVIRDKPDAKPLAVGKGAIRFNHVTFHYAPGAGGIDGINLEVPAGKTVALVGHSGSGKSTLVNLLLRFYELESGPYSGGRAGDRGCDAGFTARRHVARQPGDCAVRRFGARQYRLWPHGRKRRGYCGSC